MVQYSTTHVSIHGCSKPPTKLRIILIQHAYILYQDALKEAEEKQQQQHRKKVLDSEKTAAIAGAALQSASVKKVRMLCGLKNKVIDAWQSRVSAVFFSSTVKSFATRCFALLFHQILSCSITC